MASSSLGQMAQSVIARSKTLVNNDLKRICKEEGQIQTGNKIHLQTRVIGLINEAVYNNDVDMLNRLRHRVYNHGDCPPYNAQNFPIPNSSPVPAYSNTQNGHGHQSSLSHGASSMFKSSPFYQIRELVCHGITLDASPSHRQSVQKPLYLTDAQATDMKADPSLRLLLFSALDQTIGGYSNIDVAFPSQIEVKINGDEVKANFKGLKNKPGSTRPADVTDLVRKTAHYKNNLQITYALTQKKYNMYVYMVKKDSIDDLCRKIKERNVITKDSVIKEMQRKADDPDIEVGSVNLSLKDPISTLRITLPIRSVGCTHNRCFDAESFLQLQEQAPTWTCPICNKLISYDGLAVDEYVQEILAKVSRNTDQVTIDPHGKWSQINDADQGRSSRTSGIGASYDNSDDDDDDLIEISDHRISAIKSEAVPTPQSLAHTPSLPSREPSNTPRGTKRKSEVIDLTLSDDDEPPRPTKQVAYRTPNSLPDPSRRYQIPPSYSLSSNIQRPSQLPTSRHSTGLRHDPMLPLPNPHAQQHTYPYQGYRPAEERQSYPAQGSSTYPTYLGSSSP